jgi:hypothetical protein
MIARIRAGSLTTDSLSAIGLRLAMSASISGSVTVQPFAGLFIDEHRRAIVAAGLWVDADKH